MGRPPPARGRVVAAFHMGRLRGLHGGHLFRTGRMPRLKVVHAAKFYPPSRGGMETVVGDLCEGTAGEWDVRVVAANEGRHTTRERREGVDVVRAGTLATAQS